MGLCLAASACSGVVDVTAPSPSGTAAHECAKLIHDLPTQVDGLDQRAVTPENALAGAWGDPPIVLRCGVGRPAGLRRDSRCPTINNVGWLAHHTDDGWLFTTIGRSAYVEVRVPADYQPASDALVDLAAVIKAQTSWPHPCK
ncbi:MAG: DUF3515 domain-containing protein [Nocardioidaceae bacterium]